MIRAEDQDHAREVLREFLLRDPEEPAELLDLPPDQWAEVLVESSPALHQSNLRVVSPEELRPAKNQELNLINETSLEEFLGLVAERR